VHRVLRLRGGRRVAYTNTSRYTDAQLVAALRHLQHHVNLDRTIVHFKAGGSRATCGTMYAGLPWMTNTAGLVRHQWRYLIVVTDTGWYGTLNTLAHEAKHVEQYREGTYRRWGREPAASAFARWWAQLYTTDQKEVAA
jgi:hypothetical protein